MQIKLHYKGHVTNSVITFSEQVIRLIILILTPIIAYNDSFVPLWLINCLILLCVHQHAAIFVCRLCRVFRWKQLFTAAQNKAASCEKEQKVWV